MKSKKFEHLPPSELRAVADVIRKEVLLSKEVAQIMNVRAAKEGLNLKNYMERILLQSAKDKNFKLI